MIKLLPICLSKILLSFNILCTIDVSVVMDAWDAVWKMLKKRTLDSHRSIFMGEYLIRGYVEDCLYEYSSIFLFILFQTIFVQL